MNIELMVVEFRLPGCESLKEKRQRLVGLRERFGKLINVAVCESDFQDAHKQAQWSFVVASTDPRIVANQLSKIEEYLSTEVDAMITDVHREKL